MITDDLIRYCADIVEGLPANAPNLDDLRDYADGKCSSSVYPVESEKRRHCLEIADSLWLLLFMGATIDAPCVRNFYDAYCRTLSVDEVRDEDRIRELKAEIEATESELDNLESELNQLLSKRRKSGVAA